MQYEKNKYSVGDWVTVTSDIDSFTKTGDTVFIEDVYSNNGRGVLYSVYNPKQDYLIEVSEDNLKSNMGISKPLLLLICFVFLLSVIAIIL